MKFGKTVSLLAIISMLWTCNADETPELELGRYEYAGFDNTTFRFFRIENNNTYREVNPKFSEYGIGYFKSGLCEFAEGILYGCGQYPNVPKPYFELQKDQVKVGLFDPINEELLEGMTEYKIVGDTVIVGEEPDVYKFLTPKKGKIAEIKIPYRVGMSTAKSSAPDLILDEGKYTEKEHLDELRQQYKAKAGDTLAILLFYELYKKK
jgi:hypothetical protein